MPGEAPDGADEVHPELPSHVTQPLRSAAPIGRACDARPQPLPEHLGRVGQARPADWHAASRRQFLRPLGGLLHSSLLLPPGGRSPSSRSTVAMTNFATSARSTPRRRLVRLAAQFLGSNSPCRPPPACSGSSYCLAETQPFRSGPGLGDNRED